MTWCVSRMALILASCAFVGLLDTVEASRMGSSWFLKFEGVYGKSSEFPEQAKAWIPGEYWSAVDEGKEKFFLPIKETQPRTFRALIEQCGQLHLLESITESASLYTKGKLNYLYRWGLECGDRLVVIGIPVAYRKNPIVQQTQAKYFEALPSEFHGYYETMNGMMLWSREKAWSEGWDLPAGFGLPSLEIHFNSNDLPKAAFKKIFRGFGKNNDLRLWVNGSAGDMIFLDLSKRDKQLYHVRANDPSNYTLILNPEILLDQYFAAAIGGFTSPASLRE